MMKGSKGLSALVIVIIIAIIIVVLLMVVFMFKPETAESPTEPNGETPGTTQPELEPESETLVPLDEIPESWLEAFPELSEEYPEGVPLDVLREVEERMML